MNTGAICEEGVKCDQALLEIFIGRGGILY